MTSAAEASAAPVDVTFTKADKTKVVMKLSPMVEADYAEFERFVQGRIVDLASTTLTRLSEDERTSVIAKVIVRAATIDCISSEYVRAMTTVEGAAKLLQLSFSKHHPDITSQEILDLIHEDPEALRQAMDKYDLLNNARSEPKKKQRVRVVKRKKVKRVRKKKRVMKIAG